MNKVIKSVTMAAAVAVVLGVTASGTAEANGPKGSGHRNVVARTTVVRTTVVRTPAYRAPVSSYHNWHVSHGTRFSNGYYFRGGDYRFFRYRVWNNSYRCWTFYYPDLGCYYYWSGANGCFYPLSYAPVVAPNGLLPDGTIGLPLQQALPGQPMPYPQQGVPY